MAKQTIGKVQIIIGIILLLLVISGIIWSVLTFRDMQRLTNTPLTSLQGDTDSEKLANIQLILFQADIKTNLLIGILSTSIVLFFLSLLFMTQGRANMSDK